MPPRRTRLSNWPRQGSQSAQSASRTQAGHFPTLPGPSSIWGLARRAPLRAAHSLCRRFPIGTRLAQHMLANHECAGRSMLVRPLTCEPAPRTASGAANGFHEPLTVESPSSSTSVLAGERRPQRRSPSKLAAQRAAQETTHQNPLSTTILVGPGGAGHARRRITSRYQPFRAGPPEGPLGAGAAAKRR